MKKNRLIELYQKANQRTGGSLELLKRTYQQYVKHKANRAAAGMTYYTLFSLFPLLIVMVTVTSYFVESEEAINKINQAMTAVIPVSENLIQRNIQRVVDLRGSVGLVGLVGFLWSASNTFSMLVENINQAFPKVESQSFIRKRLLAFAILGTIITLLVLVLLTSTAYDLLLQLQISFLENSFIHSTMLGSMSVFLPWVMTFLLFVALYRWVPDTDVKWKAATWTGGVVTLLWQIVSNGIRWYLRSGLANYELVYGSLSAIVILMFWIYLSSLIIFFGAHLCAILNQSIGEIS